MRRHSVPAAISWLVPAVLAVLAAPTLLAQAPVASPSPAPSPAASAAPSPAAGQPSFPAQVEIVNVDAVVVDKKGQPVLDLTKDDFVLTEDGVVQTVSTFESINVKPEPPSEAPPTKPAVSTNVITSEAEAGRSYIVIYDDIHMAPSQGRLAKNAITKFLEEGVREGDKVTLVSTAGNAWWTSRMPGGRSEMMTLLKHLEGRIIPDNTNPERMSDYEAMRIHVYNDTAIRERVTRRWQNFGVQLGSDTPRRGSQTVDPNGDPMVMARAQEVYLQSVTKNRITLDLIQRVLEALSGTRGRKSLVLVSEGFIYDPNLVEFKGVVQASRRANCAIYFLDTRGLQGLSDYFSAEYGPSIDPRDLGGVLFDPVETAAGSESIADDTGGFSVKNTNDLSKGFLKIADETHTYYLLGYYPANTRKDGKFRKIGLKVTRKGLEVRARKGYYAALEGGVDPLARDEKKKREAGDPAFQRALDSPFDADGIPLRMTAFVFEETLLGKAKCYIQTEVDVSRFGFQEKDGRFLDTLEFLLVAAHRETGEYFRYDQKVDMKLLPETKQKIVRSWFPILREFELPAGGYQAKIVVRDKNSGVLGTVLHEFEVPDLSSFRTSTPVLSDSIAQAGEKGQPTRPALMARRSFPTSATLFCQFEVYGATTDKTSGMPSVAAGYRIQSKDGAVFRRIEPTTIKPTSLGKLSRMVGTSLEGAAPGDYELVLTLKDDLDGKTLEIKEPFTVEAQS